MHVVTLCDAPFYLTWRRIHCKHFFKHIVWNKQEATSSKTVVPPEPSPFNQAHVEGGLNQMRLSISAFKRVFAHDVLSAGFICFMFGKKKYIDRPSCRANSQYFGLIARWEYLWAGLAVVARILGSRTETINQSIIKLITPVTMIMFQWKPVFLNIVWLICLQLTFVVFFYNFCHVQNMNNITQSGMMHVDNVAT